MTWKWTYAGDGELEPEDEDRLESEVPGEVVQDNTGSERLEEVEEAEHDPVSQPLDVVIVTRGLESLDGEVGGDAPANEVGDRGREGVDRVKGTEDNNCANEGVALGDLCPLLELVERWVLGELAKRETLRMKETSSERKQTYLLIKLGNVVVCLVLGLDEGGVLLDFLRGGHLVVRHRRRGCQEANAGVAVSTTRATTRREGRTMVYLAVT